MFPDSGILVLVLITFLAAVVNGGLGHGFSSLTVPVGLLFYTNRLLNPALVLVEVGINSSLVVMNRQSIPQIWKRVLPIIAGLIPGILLGSYLLSSVNPGLVKFLTYSVLLPLILLQAAGCRRPIRSEKAIGIPFGAGLGTLYSLTTISGPPLACLFNNQGFVQRDFRAAMGLIRITESSLTAAAYFSLGLFTAESLQLLPLILPGVILGFPLGAFLVKRLDPAWFRRVCMSFDTWVVGFGLSRVVIQLGLIPGPQAYLIWAGAIVMDGILFYRFIQLRAALAQASTPVPADRFRWESVKREGGGNGKAATGRTRDATLVGTGDRNPQPPV